jgi:hypothetical protein
LLGIWAWIISSSPSPSSSSTIYKNGFAISQ